VWQWHYPARHRNGLKGMDAFDPPEPKEFADFDLLNIVFPHFGSPLSFNPDRWITGTPYGPCDIVPWDAPAEAMQRYRVLAMLGAHRMEAAWWENYLAYVRNGGTLVMGLYQLLSPQRDRVYFRTDISDLFGVRLGEDRPLPRGWNILLDRQAFTTEHYNRIDLAGAEVIERLPNGDPLLVRSRAGDGWAYFFTTDRLTSAPGIGERRLRELFEPYRPLTLEPQHDWMEVAVSRKGDVRIVTLMDHRQDRVPVETNEPAEPYSGTARINLDALELLDGDYEVLAVEPKDKITRLETRPACFRQDGRSLEVRIDRMGPCVEWVVGPGGRAKKEFFWGESDRPTTAEQLDACGAAASRQ
jgi:hypothetical protein